MNLNFKYHTFIREKYDLLSKLIYAIFGLISNFIIIILKIFFVQNKKL